MVQTQNSPRYTVYENSKKAVPRGPTAAWPCSGTRHLDGTASCPHTLCEYFNQCLRHLFIKKKLGKIAAGKEEAPGSGKSEQSMAARPEHGVGGQLPHWWWTPRARGKGAAAGQGAQKTDSHQTKGSECQTKWRLDHEATAGSPKSWIWLRRSVERLIFSEPFATPSTGP